MKLDKRACRHAANAPLNISLNAGVLYTERVKCLVTAAVKLLGGHRALAVYFYECERLKANDRMPKWVVFQGKDDFATLERDAEGNVKWRDSMLENLVDESFYKFRESCVFYKGTDGVTISDFINQSASGITILEALQVYQYGIRNKQAKHCNEAHDELSRYIKKCRDEQTKRAFREVYEHLAEKANLTSKKLQIVCPKQTDDLIAEGQALHHCVGTYIERVAAKKCLIVFVRRVEEPKKPYVTVEVRNGKIEQIHGDHNSDPTEEVKKFVDLWSRKVLPMALQAA